MSPDMKFKKLQSESRNWCFMMRLKKSQNTCSDTFIINMCKSYFRTSRRKWTFLFETYILYLIISNYLLFITFRRENYNVILQMVRNLSLYLRIFNRISTKEIIYFFLILNLSKDVYIYISLYIYIRPWSLICHSN